MVAVGAAALCVRYCTVRETRRTRREEGARESPHISHDLTPAMKRMRSGRQENRDTVRPGRVLRQFLRFGVCCAFLCIIVTALNPAPRPGPYCLLTVTVTDYYNYAGCTRIPVSC